MATDISDINEKYQLLDEESRPKSQFSDEFRAMDSKYETGLPTIKSAPFKPESWWGETSAGLSRGFDSLNQVLYGGGALAADYLGLDGVKNWMLEGVEENQRAMEENPASIASYDDVKDFDSGMRYFLGHLGQGAPMLAESAATGLIGAAIGTGVATPGAGTLVGGLSGMVGRQAVKELIKTGLERTIKKELVDYAQGKIAKEALSETAERALAGSVTKIAKRYGKFGMYTAVAGNSVAIESGSIYSDLLHDPNISESDRRHASLVGGMIAAVPDTIVGGYIVGKFFPGGAAVTRAMQKGAQDYAIRFTKTFGKEVLKVSAFESGTEYFQTMVEEAAKNWADPAKRDAIFDYTEEQKKSFIDAAFAGGIMGIMGGGLTAVASTPRYVPPHNDPAVRTAERDVASRADDILPPVVPTDNDQRLSVAMAAEASIEEKLQQPNLTPEQTTLLQAELEKATAQKEALLAVVGTDSLVNQSSPKVATSIQDAQKQEVEALRASLAPRMTGELVSKVNVSEEAIAEKQSEINNFTGILEGETAEATTAYREETKAFFTPAVVKFMAAEDIKIQFTSADSMGGKTSYGVGADANGRITLSIPKTKSARSLSHTQTSLDHETTHMALYVGLRDEHNAGPKTEKYEDFVKARVESIGDAAIAAFPSLPRQFIEMYSPEFAQSKEGATATLSSFDIGNETIRIIGEMARKGTLTEATEALLYADRQLESGVLNNFTAKWLKAIKVIYDKMLTFLDIKTAPPEIVKAVDQMRQVLDKHGLLVNKRLTKEGKKEAKKEAVEAEKKDAASKEILSSGERAVAALSPAELEARREAKEEKEAKTKAETAPKKEVKATAKERVEDKKAAQTKLRAAVKAFKASKNTAADRAAAVGAWQETTSLEGKTDLQKRTAFNTTFGSAITEAQFKAATIAANKPLADQNISIDAYNPDRLAERVQEGVDSKVIQEAQIKESIQTIAAEKLGIRLGVNEIQGIGYGARPEESVPDSLRRWIELGRLEGQYGTSAPAIGVEDPLDTLLTPEEDAPWHDLEAGMRNKFRADNKKRTDLVLELGEATKGVYTDSEIQGIAKELLDLHRDLHYAGERLDYSKNYLKKVNELNASLRQAVKSFKNSDEGPLAEASAGKAYMEYLKALGLEREKTWARKKNERHFRELFGAEGNLSQYSAEVEKSLVNQSIDNPNISDINAYNPDRQSQIETIDEKLFQANKQKPTKIGESPEVTGDNVQAAEDFIRGEAQTGISAQSTRRSGAAQYRPNARKPVEQEEALEQWARDAGRLLKAQPAWTITGPNNPELGKAEHSVFVEKTTGRMMKITNGGFGKVMIDAIEDEDGHASIKQVDPTVLDYLDRMRQTNTYHPGVDWVLHAAWRDTHGRLRILTSQAFVHGKRPTFGTGVYESLKAAKFIYTPGGYYYRTSDNVLILDAHEGNGIVTTTDGVEELVLFDVIYLHPDAVLQRALKVTPADKEMSMNEVYDQLLGPNPLVNQSTSINAYNPDRLSVSEESTKRTAVRIADRKIAKVFNAGFVNRDSEMRPAGTNIEFSSLNFHARQYASAPRTESIAEAQRAVTAAGGALKAAEILNEDPLGIALDLQTEIPTSWNAPLAAVYELVMVVLDQASSDLEKSGNRSDRVRKHLSDQVETMVLRLSATNRSAAQGNDMAGKVMKYLKGHHITKAYIEPLLSKADHIFGYKKGAIAIRKMEKELKWLYDNYIRGAISSADILRVMTDNLKNWHTKPWQAAMRKAAAKNKAVAKKIASKAARNTAHAIALNDNSGTYADHVIGNIIGWMTGSAKGAETKDEIALFTSVLNSIAKEAGIKVGVITPGAKAEKKDIQKMFLVIMKNDQLYAQLTTKLRDQFIQTYGKDNTTIIEQAEDLFEQMSNQAWTDGMVTSLVNKNMAELELEYSKIVREAYTEGDTPGEFSKKKVVERIRTMLKDEGITNEALVDSLADSINDSMEEHLSNAREKFFGSKVAVNQAIPNIGKYLNLTQKSLTDLAKSHYDLSNFIGENFEDYIIREFGLPEAQAVQLARLMEKNYNQMIKDKKEAIIKKYMEDATKDASDKVKSKVSSAVDRLIELSNLGVMNDERIYTALAEKFGLPKYNKEAAEDMRRIADQIGSVTNERQADDLRQTLSEILMQQKGVTPLDVFISAYYASILSGLSTGMVNVGGNLSNLVGLVVVEATKNPKNVIPILRAIIRTAMGQGLAELRESWYTGRSLSKHGSKFFYGGNSLEQANPIISSTLKIPLLGEKGSAIYNDVTVNAAKRAHALLRGVRAQYVGRSLAAVDAMFYTMAREAAFIAKGGHVGTTELMNAALTEARRDMTAIGQNPDGDKKMRSKFKVLTYARYNEMRLLNDQNKPDHQKVIAWHEASQGALDATYTQIPQGVLGELCKLIEALTERFPLLKMIVPFTRVAANVTNTMLEWTPFGFGRYAISGVFNEDFTVEKWNKETEKMDRVANSDIARRAFIGTFAMIGLMAMLGSEDEEEPNFAVYADGPRDFNKQRQMRAQGWKPYTIKYGDTYYSYLYTPLSIGFSIIGRQFDDFRDGKVEAPSVGNIKLASTATAMLRAVTSQSFLAGVSDIMGAVDSPDPEKKLSSIMARMTTAPLIPNFVKQMDKFFNPTVEEANGFWETFLKEIPVVRSHALKPALNVFGEPVRRLTGGFPGAERFLTFRPTEDPVLNLLSEKRIIIPGFSKSSHIDNARMDEEQFYEYVSTAGPDMKQTIQAELHRLGAMTNEEAQERVNDIATKTKATTRKKMSAKKRASS